MIGALGLAAMILAYLIAVTWPFQWITNGASLDHGAATFETGGILESRGKLSWIDEVIMERQLIIELTVRPFLSDQSGPARILTISKDYMHRNLTIAQEGRDLVVRLRRSTDTPNGTPPYVVPQVFSGGELRNIVVSIEEDSLSVGVDGQLRLRRSLPEHALSYWDSGFRLALGNELVWGRPWLGEIDRARLRTSSRSVDLLTPDMIERPGLHELFARRLTLGTSNVGDVLLNLFAFVPIGLLSVWYLPRTKLVVVAAIWFTVCLTGECLQIFIAPRFPSVSDLLLNVSGALLGAGIGIRAMVVMGRTGSDGLETEQERAFGAAGRQHAPTAAAKPEQ